MGKDFEQIKCQFNHTSPIQFFVLDDTQDLKAKFFCQKCLTTQTLPNNAKSFNEAKEKILQQKQQQLEITKILIQKKVQLIEQLAIEIDSFKTFIMQQMNQSQQDIKLWRQQLETSYLEEKNIDFESEMESFHLNSEEYKLKEQIRIEQKLLNFNNSFNQKIHLKIKCFFNLEEFQKCQQILDKSVDGSELQNLQQQQEEFELNKTLVIQNFPNKWFLLGKFDHIQDSIKQHLLNWRTYTQNTMEIVQFYDDMNHNYEFLTYLFPNFYKSKYNPKSTRLTPQERNEIINNEQVAKQLVENFQMYLFFAGLQMQEDKINVQNEKQFKSFRNQTNREGLQRVISSLSVLNQRKYALLLVKFIKEADFFYDSIFLYYDLLQEEGNQDQNALSFEKVRESYVQLEIMNQEWVSSKILTNKTLDV
ncbi:unnamed protein product (macronuclear) [Paramecium tetraurelia]|uniref:Opioid growth factor receptor (OGFr) conserved domain-containing protein n=1 Tax=Paramecium tetraurelia TaxID=5888 RepID=A0E1X2_PARTE|nr:uncharacterized protein GSPATT00022460001 [Paramecium tetraurelia]CAK89289.1 unnamed protein product [Paramecium tetraurelia]|eukprot:XP_001456686.1 hypothetical protein (macronuclear) [Paramecium tetraurelia strain d4-2]